jgi:hypothetical protein
LETCTIWASAPQQPQKPRVTVAQMVQVSNAATATDEEDATVMVNREGKSSLPLPADVLDAAN